MERKLKMARSKLEKAEEQLSNAQNKVYRKKGKSQLLHKEKPKSKLSFDEERAKPSEKLKDKVKPSQKLIDKNTFGDKMIELPKHETKFIRATRQQLRQGLHSEINKNEDDNVGVEATQSAEKAIEFTGNKVSEIRNYQKFKPYKKLVKAENKALKARVNYVYEKISEKPINSVKSESIRNSQTQNFNSSSKLKFQKGENTQSNPLSKFQQKRQIKKQYANVYRNSYKNTSNVFKSTTKKGFDVVKKVVVAVAKDPKALVVILIAAFLVFIIVGVVSSVSTIMEGTLNSLVSTSYTSEDEELLKVEESYLSMEVQLQKRIDNIESEYPGYDEYRYNLAEIGHDPHELASYFTALLQYYTAEEISAQLAELFNLQYVLTITPVTEIRYRTETRYSSWTDSNGVSHSYSYTVEVPYEYHILNVSLENNAIDILATRLLSDEQLEMYDIYRETKGNKPDLFGEYNESNSPPINYQVPGDALTDPEFAALIQEAEKYLGYEYVWGGSSPETSFDCSGFVCWVLNQSGNANIGRTNAQGIFNQCGVVSSSEVQPGDLVFFEGTYSSSNTVTHIGIYVGNGMMIHAGNPIGYANINSSYWAEHFYSFGRLHTEQ